MRGSSSIAAFLFAGLTAVAPVFATSQVACPTLLSEYNRVRKTEDKAIPAIERVAKKFNTSPFWVENCIRMYGRNVPTNKLDIDHDVREQQLESMEETELGPEDLAPEDLSEPDPLIGLESAGTRKRQPNEYIRRQEYAPVGSQQEQFDPPQ